MNTNITVRIDATLKALWNTEDPFYKTVISDKNGTNPDIISKPTDIDLGFMASLLEYLRRLQNSLIDQMYLDKASHEFVKFILFECFNIPQIEGETDASWIARARSQLFMPKVSRAAIIKALRKYSSPDAEISYGGKSSMYADVSFADRYKKDLKINPHNNKLFNVFPSISLNFDDTSFNITVTLYGTKQSDVKSVVDLLSNTVIAGIKINIQIKQ